MTKCFLILSFAAVLLLGACSTSSPSSASAETTQIDASAAAAILADVESGKYGALDELGNTGINLRLTPDTANPEAIFVLEATNGGLAQATVEKIGLVQIGRISTHMTEASEHLPDARVVNWQLAAGETKELRLDLREIVFDGIDEGAGRRPAIEFLRAIPSADRELTVVVWHRSPKWPTGVQEPVSYP
jgi:hypothetical protein